MIDAEMLARILARIDALHAEDPKQAETDDGVRPAELVYAERMSRQLAALAPQASAELQIAVRAQHLCRWRLPREEYPRDRKGYRRWRTDCAALAADLAAEAMAAEEAPEPSIERVRALVRKQRLKADPEAQALEDTACLVFLRYEFDAFAPKVGEEKLVKILQRTWKKMSEAGRQAALDLPLSARAHAFVTRALAE